jgi:hypothetical protein
VRRYVEHWLSAELYESWETTHGYTEAADLIRDHPRRQVAVIRMWGGPRELYVADWPLHSLVEDGPLHLEHLVGVGLFRPTRLVCRVCRRDFRGLKVEGDGYGVFDRWRDGRHELLLHCPLCGASRRDADLIGVLAL